MNVDSQPALPQSSSRVGGFGCEGWFRDIGGGYCVVVFPGFKLLDRFLIRVWEGWGYCTVPGLDTVQLPALRQQCT